MTPDETLCAAAQELVRRETRYLNTLDLENWIKLFTSDGYYWMPLEEQHEDPEQNDSLMYDNVDLMHMRMHNLGNPLSPSMQLPIRSRRIVSELEFNEIKDSDTDFAATATVIAFIQHRQQDSFAGTVSYRFCQHNDGLKIRHKRVDLINADAPLDSVMIYV